MDLITWTKGTQAEISSIFLRVKNCEAHGGAKSITIITGRYGTRPVKNQVYWTSTHDYDNEASKHKEDYKNSGRGKKQEVKRESTT